MKRLVRSVSITERFQKAVADVLFSRFLVAVGYSGTMKKVGFNEALNQILEEDPRYQLAGAIVVVAVIAGIWFQDINIAWLIAVAMTINLISAAISGALIPLALDRFGTRDRHGLPRSWIDAEATKPVQEPFARELRRGLRFDRMRVGPGAVALARSHAHRGARESRP